MGDIDYEDLHVVFDGSCLFVTIDDASINYRKLHALEQLIRDASKDSMVRALVLDVFVQGENVGNLGEIPEELAHRKPSGSHGAGPLVEQNLLRALHEFMKPTVALLRNAVSGFGIDLASVCDVRVCNASMKMVDRRIHQGRAAATGITYILPRLIGLSQSMRILLLGEDIGAEEAHRIHFVHRVVPDDEFDDFKLEFGKKIGSMATRAWEVHKLQVLKQLDLDFDAAMVHSLGIRQTHVIKDRIEGIQAWRERRDPKFTGE